MIFTLYWKKGDDLSTGNLYNIQAVLFMWVVLPAYNSASTMPTLVMERQLFTRCCLYRAGVWGRAGGCVGDMGVVGKQAGAALDMLLS